MSLPICEHTDLPRILCEHCDSFTMTSGEIDYLNGRVDPSPTHHVIPAVPFRMEYPSSRKWLMDIPVVVVCYHGRPEGVALCQDCVDDFERTVGDVPAVMADLEVAMTKQVAFVQQGAPLDADPDEAPLDWSDGAAKAVKALRAALGGEPVVESRRLLREWQATLRGARVAELAGRITRAVRYAHAVIDAPPHLVAYGECPQCHGHIRQERVRDPKGQVRHDCGYAATLEEHQHAQLDLAVDQLMTVNELVNALTLGGEPVTRSKINTLIAKYGLPEESRPRPKWSDGELVAGDLVKVYRLGDVRDMLDSMELEQGSISTDAAAAILGVTPGAVRKMVERGQIQPIRKTAKPLRFTPSEVASVMARKSA